MNKKPGSERPLISFSHGRHCDGTVFDETRKILEDAGWLTIAPTYDITKGDKDLNYHADQLAEEEAATGAEEVWRYGWSWGANPAIRDRGGPRIIRMSLVAGALHPASTTWAEGAVPPAHHNLLYDTFEKVVSNKVIEKEELDEEKIKEAFYELAKNCIFTGVRDEAVIRRWAEVMRLHPRRETEPLLEDTPKAPIDYIVLTNDNTVLNQEDGEDEYGNPIKGIADGLAKVVKVEKVYHDSDHAPMVSDPAAFAGLIISRAVAVKSVPVYLN